MRYIVLLILLAGSSMALRSQTTADEKAVIAVIDQLFNGMRKGDSAMVRRTFVKDPQMITSVKTKDGRDQIKKSSLKGLLLAVGKPHDKVFDERLSNTVVKVDGAIAQVWTDYMFYVGDQFSHCGTDAFHLVKNKGQWKIVSLMDTRRKSPCEE